jgi:hypothetical protein
MNGVNLLGATGPGPEPGNAAQLGTKVVRYSLAWRNLEPTSGTSTRNALQGVVNAVNNAHSEGMRVLVSLKTSAPPFARTYGMDDSPATCTPEN